jgi:phage protein D
VAEEEISNSVLATIVGTKTRIAVASAWANTRLSVVASKKGFKKKYTYRFTTNSEGDYIFKSGVNLKGYTVILYKGTEELDRDFV